MTKMEVMSLRISQHEKDYLASIAEKYGLKKQGSDEFSHTKALKFMLSYCLHNDIDFHQKEGENIAEIRKMIEQIHASIPHVMYHQKFQSVVLANKYSDEEIEVVQNGSLQYINESFSGFQNIKYRFAKSNMNKFGLKTMPLEEGYSAWS